MGNFSLGETPLSPQKNTPLPPRSPGRLRRFLLWLFGFLIVSALLFVIFVFVAHVTFTRSLHFENRELSFLDSLTTVGKGFFGNTPILKGEKDGRINILLLGRAGEKFPGRNLTDTVMLASLDTETKRVALLSLPRDLFAPIPGTSTSTKLNALYQYGLSSNMGGELVKKSVAAMTGLPVHYFVSIDFTGFEQVVDSLGGVTVDVPRTFHDTQYPGKNYSYETFDLEKGWQKLDGATTLKYVRERHADPLGDFGRAGRQQQVLTALRAKALSLPPFLNPFTFFPFVESLGQSVTTDMSPDEMERLIDIGKKFDTVNIETVVLDAWKPSSLLRVDHLNTPSGVAFILVPRSGDWDEVHDLAAHLFDPTHETARREALEKESPNILVVSTPQRAVAAQTFETALEKEFPSMHVSFETAPSLEKLGETAMIVDRTALGKPYTLDTLMKRYGLKKVTGVPVALSPRNTSSPDFIIVFNKASAPQALSTETDTPLPESTYDFQEPLPPQPTHHE